jgi:hypothetical protein
VSNFVRLKGRIIRPFFCRFFAGFWGDFNLWRQMAEIFKKTPIMAFKKRPNRSTPSVERKKSCDFSLFWATRKDLIAVHGIL